MIWPRPLPPPSTGLGAERSPLAEALRSLSERAALVWARALELEVEVQPEPASSGAGLVHATAAWRTATGEEGALQVETQLIAGVLQRLAGVAGRALGPLPLSPTEEGLFAWLTMQWLAELPSTPRLTWVHGGDPDWPLRRPGRGCVEWRMRVGEQVGAARWWLPPAAPTPAEVGRVWLPLWCGGWGSIASTLQPGALLPLRDLALHHAAGPLHGLRLHAGHLEVRKDPLMTPVEELPVPIRVELCRLELQVAEVAALQPGALLPLELAEPPLVKLWAGERMIGVGVLVDDGGALSVQITRAP